MKIALCSDEYTPLHEVLIKCLEERGHQVVRFGAIQSKKDEPWVRCTQEASQSVIRGQCDEGIFLCWSGTGACIAANKLKGIRAALCWDSETAKLARLWNHANVLVLANRILNEDLLKEILVTWFENYDQEVGTQGVKELESIG